MSERTERDEILDFPGADELVAAGAVAPPSARTIAAARARLRPLAEREDRLLAAPAAVLSDEPLVVLGRGAPSRAVRPTRRRVLVAGAAVAVLAAGAVACPAVDVGSESTSAASTATRFLNDMAEVSAKAPASRGKYWMFHYEAKDGPPGRAPVLLTVYSDRSGNAWLRKAKGKLTPTGHNWLVGERSLSWKEFDRLPTEPEELKTHFPKNAADRYFQIMSLLADSPASPELRSAMFRIAAETPGVTMTPNVKDSRGRPGTVINLRRKVEVPKEKLKLKPSGASHTYVDGPYYFITPKTSRVLENASDLGANPRVRTTYLKVGWTNHVR
ncbi:hypothetical protein [Streptomyces flavofungini]|uniref:hypothetical protein n=1 Tax=Streptomyces flavofungini TaxID=68200 RepID=UPI0025B13F1E|nr:hypothetical protein [Streptomyces flavofungini]WJV46608.1 hypothetical protein QUY26_14375 [Streptomyces flavofungini]